jgi:hypothetical protein
MAVIGCPCRAMRTTRCAASSRALRCSPRCAASASRSGLACRRLSATSAPGLGADAIASARDWARLLCHIAPRPGAFLIRADSCVAVALLRVGVLFACAEANRRPRDLRLPQSASFVQPAFGIASGHVFVGRSGSLTRCEYTTSGADVILAGDCRCSRHSHLQPAGCACGTEQYSQYS